ncbi:MAG TPA: SURF1 family protein [Ferrovibrio sp.]|uniref:SURF1 family protein n=1 Tax=Ferrovibrio sp. TaxID=1917215 RepID=UPI002ED3DD84
MITIPALIVLLALGTWQVQRLFWKLDLIATVQHGLEAAPVPLPAGVLDPAEWNYRRVVVTGTFDNSHEFHLMAHSKRGNFGYHVLVPLKRSDAPGYVFVDRGWIPPEKKDRSRREAGLLQGEQTVRGIAHKAWGPGLFTPDNDPARNLWLYPDLAAMAQLAGIGEVPALIVDADDTPVPGGAPVGGQTRVDFPNNHLEYAVTWYGGAIVLALIYVLWHRRRARDTASKD